MTTRKTRNFVTMQREPLNLFDVCAISISLIGVAWYFLSIVSLLKRRHSPQFRRTLLIGSLFFPLFTLIVFLFRENLKPLNGYNDLFLIAIFSLYFYSAMGFDIPFFFLYPYALLKDKGARNSESEGVEWLLYTLSSHNPNAKLLKCLIGSFVGSSIMTSAESLSIIKNYIEVFSAKMVPLLKQFVNLGSVFRIVLVLFWLFSYLYPLYLLFSNRKYPRVRYSLSVSPFFPLLIFFAIYVGWVLQGLNLFLDKVWIIFLIALMVFSLVYFDVAFFFLYPCAYLYDKIKKEKGSKGIKWLYKFVSLPLHETATLYGLILIWWFSLGLSVIYIFFP